MKSRLLGATALMALTPALGVEIAVAQEDSSALDEIIVTAQRREQTLLDVPISVATYGADQIEQGKWNGARDFINITPNVFFSENDSQGGKNGDISIRGVSDLTSGGNERLIQTRPAIGFYVDDFSVASVASGSANPPLGDVERIEILRGPQATYFGRSAAGGAINVVTKKPSNETSAKVSATIGSFDTYGLGVVGNVPISDTLFVRAGVEYEESDGPVKNLSPTGNSADHEYVNARLAVRWQPTDQWTIDLMAQLIREDEGNQGRIPTGLGLGGPATFVSGIPPVSAATCGLNDSIYYPSNQKVNCEDADTFTNIENEITTLRIEYAGERVNFTSISGRIGGDFAQFEDLDNSGVSAFNRFNAYESENYSQELRLSSADDWSLGNMGFDWTFGAYYYQDDFDVNNRIISGDDLNGNFLAGFLTVPGDFPNENEQNVEREGYALFADVTLDVTEQLSLSVGGRYSHDKDEQFWNNTFASFDCGTRALDAMGVPAPLVPGCALRPDQTTPLPVFDDGSGALFVTGGRFAQDRFSEAQTSGNDFSPRIALNWNANDDHSIYLTYSRGYRPSGVRVAPDSLGVGQQDLSIDVPDNRSVFSKEQVINYELGWKGYLADRRVLIEAAIFMMDWNDMQVRLSRTLCQEPDGSFVPIEEGSANCVGLFPDNRIENAEKARSQGAEISMTAKPSDALTITGAVGYLDAKFKDFQNSELGDVSGLQLPNSPEWSFAGSAQYDWTVNDSVGGYARIEFSHKASTHVRFGDITNSDFPFRAPSFTLANLRAGLDWENHSLNLAVNNVFGEDYIAGVDSFSSLGPVVLPHRRNFTLTWTAKFGS